MSRWNFLPPILLAVVLPLSPHPLAGQAQPLSKVFEIARPRTSPWPSVWHYYWGASAVDLGPLGYAVGWTTGYMSHDPRDRDRVAPFAEGLRLDRQGHAGLGLLISTEPDFEYGVEPPLLTSLGGAGFVAALPQWRFGGADLWFRRFRGDGQPLDPESRRLGDAPDDQWNTGLQIASNAEGRFVLAWTRGPSGDTRQISSLLFQVFEPSGEPATSEIEVLTGDAAQGVADRAVGLDAAGNVNLVWQKADGLSFARYDRDGEPLLAPQRIGDPVGSVALAQEPAGGFVLATLDLLSAPGAERSLRLRAYRTDGTRTGIVVEVHRSAEVTAPALARDRFGNLALLWFEGARPALALFSRVPSEPVVLVRQGPVLFDPPVTFAQGYPFGRSLTLGDDGRLLTVWLGKRAGRARDSVLGRLWQARKDADLCLVRGFHVLCDLANDGGKAEFRMPFGPSGVPRALGDLDGDGHADACYFQDRRFLCDTAHDGGIPESQSAPFPMVPAGAQLFLADVDGEDDGAADPCYRAGSRWVCLVWNQVVGTHAISWTFGTGADPGAMGDVDGDGRAEPCVYRNGRFCCDTAHDGGTPERTFDLSALVAGLPAGTPLLGDLDGDGRADPCVYTQGRLLCGIFPAHATRPARTIELAFGVPEDVAMLGNLDGF